MSSTGERESSSLKIKRLFFEENAEAREENDRLYRPDFEDIAEDIGDSFDMLKALIDNPEIPDHAFMAATMSWGILNTLLSAVELFRLGYSKEAMMLIRNAIEIASVAYVITADEEEHKKFIADPENYNSPKAVSKAKNAVGILGQSYGLLSNFTHAGSLHVLPHVVRNGTLYIGGYLHGETDGARGRLAVIMLKQAVSSICMLIQVPSVWNGGKSKYWVRQKDGVTFAGKPATEKALKELEEMGELLRDFGSDQA